MKKLISIFCLLIFHLAFLTAGQEQFTIMIDPAGDAKHTGRLIDNTFERGISLQCAEKLKDVITKKYKNVRVIFTRVPGETIQPLQNASFANRLNVDLYLSLYFYHEPSNPAHVSIYYYVENPITDFWHKPKKLTFYPINQAHLPALKTTQQCGNLFLQTLQDKNSSKFFHPRGLFAIPFLPLMGIKAPALALEIGLKQKQDWLAVIDPIVIAIERIMT